MLFRNLLGAALLITAAAVIVIILRNGGGGSDNPPPGAVVATHNPSPGATDPSEYWTDERKRNATGG
jgi:hypothetical protein